MAMVLASLKGRQARTVSNLTHELRLWKEFSDGDTIPLDYFNLTDNEIALLERKRPPCRWVPADILQDDDGGSRRRMPTPFTP